MLAVTGAICGEVKTRPRSVPSTGLCAKVRETRQRLNASVANAREASRAAERRGGGVWEELKQNSRKRTLLRKRPKLLKRSESKTR